MQSWKPGWGSPRDSSGGGVIIGRTGPRGERERVGEATPFTITNEEDIEFAIEDDEELYDAALAASHRSGGDPVADLLRDM